MIQKQFRKYFPVIIHWKHISFRDLGNRSLINWRGIFMSSATKHIEDTPSTMQKVMHESESIFVY